MNVSIKNTRRLALLVLALALSLSSMWGQRLLADTRLQITLDDGTDVVLFRADQTSNWYYLPPSETIRIAERENGDKEFLFIKFTTDDKVENGGAQGGLLHFLVVWGLEPDQTNELASKLKEVRSSRAKVAGPVEMQPREGTSFALTSATLLDKDLTRTLVISGVAPVMEGGRAAIAARLDKNGAQLLEAAMKKNRGATDFSVEFYYDFTTVVSAADATYKYNLDIKQSQGDAMVYDLIKKELDNEPELYDQAIALYDKNKTEMPKGCEVADGLQNLMAGLQAIDIVAGNTSGGGTGSAFEYGTSESMMRKMYDFFRQKEVVTVEWSSSIADERVDAVQDAFFQMFLQDAAEPTMPEYMSLNSNPGQQIEMGDDAVKNSAQGGYRFQSCTQLKTRRKVSKEISLKKFELPVTKPYPMVYNLPGGFPVREVNLNDPFFQHRDINFIVDVEAMDIFDQEINYVTVNVRKRRSGTEDFTDAATISPAVMKDKGRLAIITYARNGDGNTETYEYQAKWSLRGGEVYPENPKWLKGNWQAVTLQAPIRPRDIEFEGDLEELREAGITRATLQLRYLKYGKETETNIPLTVSKNEPLVTGRIFTDREQTGYAYRFIINHKEQGKLATEWEAKINDDYVYASVPEELREKDTAWLQAAKDAANVLLQPGPDGTIKPGEGILGKFKEILNLIGE
ncbi:hypothetical protein FUA23_07085 [Neolewinella aurantiaca]|uniref:Uncharacterized protein n=1 Tax=Neolewinella aurantiaca TaxID=2602767 RepID=A0A5C7FIC2_9BACT|nr:hypothetical protein [Neolewinella aurantiaca]TXF90276.1 hypothetical protein FUA23_07085 [Neolewinella aurantiaca]